MSIVIRKAKETDCKGMLALIQELADYEKAGDQVAITADILRKDGFGEHPLFQVFVADFNGQIVGMALFYPRYSTWKGKTIHLEDLVVKERFRKHGIGRALFERVVLEAKNFGVGRMEWQVLDWNEPTIAFYKAIESNFDSEWVNCTLSKDQINSFQYKTINQK